MAIINSYTRDNDIKNSDVFIGTKFSNRQTVNFTAQTVADYLNINGKISIAGQMTWKFVIKDPATGTMSFALGGGAGTPFSDITELIINRTDTGGQNTEIFLEYLVNSQILIAQQNTINTFGHYYVNGYTVTSDPNFYKLELSYIAGSGGLIKDAYYDMASFVIAATADKTYVFVQGVPEATWIINHNLNKFPSVSSVNINNIQMYGEVIYIDTNNLRIEFSAGFSGKAYMN